MNDIVTSAPTNPATQRNLHCSRCGTVFACDLSGHCWCMDETAKLPMPLGGEDCLCPDCLRSAAASANS